MVKRKRGELSVGFSWSNYAVIALLGLGMCALLLISGGAMWQWVESQRSITPVRYPDFTTAVPRNLGAVRDSTPATANPRLHVPEDTALVLTTTSGDLMSASGPDMIFNDTGYNADEIIITPGGLVSGRIRNRKLYLFWIGTEYLVPVDGDVIMPAWNTTGSAIAFVVREALGDTVYRLAVDKDYLDQLRPQRLLTIPEITAPPVTNPATGRLLIVEKLGMKNTIFYTIDQNCATQSACEQSRRDLATVKQNINWADYHPNAASIVFSDIDDGNIYLLATGSGDVHGLVVNPGYKRRPVFNSKGTWLAFINVTEGNTLYLFSLNSKNLWSVPFSNVASVGWIN